MSISRVFNKTFIKIAFFCAIVACVGFLFAGCGLGKLSGGPDKSDVVTGNGSLAVQKGDYLYFVNGYRDTSAVEDTNHYGNVEQSAIFRVKLDEGRVTEKEPELDDDGEEIFDETLGLQNIDILVPKVAGFEQAKLFIFGEFLYYATPNHLKNGAGEIMSKYLHIYRVRLDRAGGNDLVYSSDSETASVQWTMHQIDDTVFMTILDGEKLVVVDINGANFRANTVAEEVTTASMPKYTSSTQTIKNIDKSIYFTQHDEDNSSQSTLKKYTLLDKKTDTVFDEENVKYEIKNTMGDHLYYTRAVSIQPGFEAKVCAMSSTGTVSTISNQSVGSDKDIREYTVTSSTQDLGILYTDGTSTYYKKQADSSAIKVLGSNILDKIVTIQGDEVYYVAESSLYKVNYTLANQTGKAVIPTGVTAKGDIANNFSVNGDKIYFFVKYTENYYMHYVDYGVTTSETDFSAYTHFVGKLLPADYVAEPAEE